MQNRYDKTLDKWVCTEHSDPTCAVCPGQDVRACAALAVGLPPTAPAPPPVVRSQPQRYVTNFLTSLSIRPMRTLLVLLGAALLLMFALGVKIPASTPSGPNSLKGQMQSAVCADFRNGTAAVTASQLVGIDAQRLGLDVAHLAQMEVMLNDAPKDC